jgi:hypothetical protein
MYDVFDSIRAAPQTNNLRFDVVVSGVRLLAPLTEIA